MKKVIVSIVNFNTKELTRKCIESVLSKKTKNPIEIWVVDNASSDGSVDILKKLPIKLIENKNNVGFGKAHNQVLEKAKGDFYLVLNSDTEIESNVIDEMVNFMDKNLNCGISNCKVLGYDGKLQPNGGDLPFGISLLSWLFNLESIGVKVAFHREDSEFYKKVREVGWVSGNFMFIKDTVIDKIGGFNKDYFMYFEDVEICFRANNEGFKVMINPEVSIKHLSGGSLDDPHLRQWSGEYKGLIIFYKHLYGFFGELFIRFLIYLSTLARILAFTLKGQIKYSLTYAKVISSL